MPANHGNPIKTLIERAINAALAEGFAQVAASLRHAISRAVFKSNSAGQCKRAVLETMSAYGGVAATHDVQHGRHRRWRSSGWIDGGGKRDHTRHGTAVGRPSRSPLNPVASSLADRDRAPQTAPAAAHAPVAPRPAARGRVEAVSRLPPASCAQPFRSSGRQRRTSTKQLEAEQVDARLAAEPAARRAAIERRRAGVKQRPSQGTEGFVEGVLPLTEFALGKARTIASGTAASPCDASARLGGAWERSRATRGDPPFSGSRIGGTTAAVPTRVGRRPARRAGVPLPARCDRDGGRAPRTSEGHAPRACARRRGRVGRTGSAGPARGRRRCAPGGARPRPVPRSGPSSVFLRSRRRGGPERRQAKRFECNPRTVHPVLFRRCVRKLRHRQTSGPTAITRGWQPPHPEAVRLLYRYTFASERSASARV